MKKKTRKKPQEAIKKIRAFGRREPQIIPDWDRDPGRREPLRQMVRAAMDFQKIRIATANREASPTETNEAELLPDHLEVILAVSEATADLETAIKASLKGILRESEIGCWLLDQPGLGSGWLAGYVLAEFPDVYDAGRCNECGIHLHRQADMSYVHPAPPERSDQSPSKSKCSFDGETMEEGTYWIHERKPSTYVRFSGLATETGYACPECGYLLRWNSSKKAWVHPRYTNLPKGQNVCPLSGAIFKPEDEASPTFWDEGTPFKAEEVNASPKTSGGRKRSFNSLLRAKLIGPSGVADAFIRQQHPKYYEIYAGYKNRVQQRDPWRSLKWVDNMARRAMMSRFVIDFFIRRREAAGLPCRPPYEEEYLGKKHHS